MIVCPERDPSQGGTMEDKCQCDKFTDVSNPAPNCPTCAKRNASTAQADWDDQHGHKKISARSESTEPTDDEVCAAVKKYREGIGVNLAMKDTLINFVKHRSDEINALRSEVERLKDQGRTACELFDEVKRLQGVEQGLTKELAALKSSQITIEMVREAVKAWDKETTPEQYGEECANSVADAICERLTPRKTPEEMMLEAYTNHCKSIEILSHNDLIAAMKKAKEILIAQLNKEHA